MLVALGQVKTGHRRKIVAFIVAVVFRRSAGEREEAFFDKRYFYFRTQFQPPLRLARGPANAR
jgi:hypothetical protein